MIDEYGAFPYTGNFVPPPFYGAGAAYGFQGQNALWEQGMQAQWEHGMPPQWEQDPQLHQEHRKQLQNQNVNKQSRVPRWWEAAAQGASQDADLFQAQFYKTRICKFYESGQCMRGNECAFAHGGTDKYSVPDLKKTSMCKKWIAGKCPKPGSQCAYAHGDSDMRVSPAFAGTRRARRTNRSNGAIPDAGASSTTASSQSTPISISSSLIEDQGPMTISSPLAQELEGWKFKSQSDNSSPTKDESSDQLMDTSNLVDELSRLLNSASHDNILAALA